MGTEQTSAERLQAYLHLITANCGGMDFARQALDVHESVEEGLGLADVGPEPIVVSQARAALDSMMAGRALAPDQCLGLEAIINEDLRPAFDIVDGTFVAAHPLWAKLQTDQDLHSNIEQVIPSVGRLELPGNPNYPYGGTGFVVGEGLLMTNRHVAQIFASGVGDKRLEFLPESAAGVDFLREFDRPTGPTLMVRRVQMIHPYWDMAILEVEGLSVAHPPLCLSLRDARTLPPGTEICVVGYPASDSRNLAAARNKVFQGRYGVKKLQPGHLQGAYSTSSFGKIVNAMTHDCSTLGGNSGSAVFDPTNREVLGLHFGGLYHERNYAVPAAALAQDSRVVDAGVMFAGTPAPCQNDWDAWWTQADAGTANQASSEADGDGATH